MTVPQLRPYQIEDAKWLASRRHALLGHQMRVGKTPCAIEGARLIGAERSLVLAPAIAVLQWQQEWKRWGGPGEVFVYSYDYAIRHPEIVRQAWDVFIADECHYARNPEAARTKLVYGRKGAAWYARHTWALSGTPVVKHAGEIWAMGTAFGYIKATYKDFLFHYCRVDPLSLRPMGTKPQHAAELNALMKQFMLRRTRKDVAPDMPEIGFDFLYVKGKPPGAEEFKGSDDELLAYLEQNAEHDAELRIVTAMAKVPALADEISFVLDNGLIERTVVFGHHTLPLEELAAVLRRRTLRVELLTGATSKRDRVLFQDAFKAGMIDVLVANLTAAGTAIDLSCASHSYFLEMSWLCADNAQAASRCVNLQTQTPVTCDVVVWPGSFDERIGKVLVRRAAELTALGL